jgi:hypothetical protein
MFHTPPVGQERIECATFEVWAKVFRAELIEPHRIIVIGRGTVYYKKKQMPMTRYLLKNN